MEKVVKNTTLTDIVVDNTGVTIPASGQYTIPPQDYALWAEDVAITEVTAAVNAGDLVINNGTIDLTAVNGLKFLEMFTAERADNEFIVKDDTNTAQDVRIRTSGEFGSFTIDKPNGTSGFMSFMPNAETSQIIFSNPNSASGVNRTFLDVDNQGDLYIQSLPGGGASGETIIGDGAPVRPDNDINTDLGTATKRWRDVHGEDFFGNTTTVSTNDTTPGRLGTKLVAGSNITLTEQNDGANETLEIAASLSSTYDYAESEGENSTTSSSYQQKLVFTYNAPEAGTYRIGYTSEIRNSSDERSAQARVRVNGTTIAEMAANYGEDSGNYYETVAGFKNITLNAGNNTIDIFYREQRGGTAYIRRARLEAEKV